MNRPFCSRSRLRRAARGTPDLLPVAPSPKPLPSDPPGETPEQYAEAIYRAHEADFTTLRTPFDR